MSTRELTVAIVMPSCQLHTWYVWNEVKLSLTYTCVGVGNAWTGCKLAFTV